MTNEIYDQINSLEATSFIAGTPYTFYFVAYQQDGVTRKNITGITIKWALCPYGNPEYTVLQKTATITNAAQGEFKVELTTPDTIALEGKFIQQPVIGTSPSEYRLGQGIVLIVSAILVT